MCDYYDPEHNVPVEETTGSGEAAAQPASTGGEAPATEIPADPAPPVYGQVSGQGGYQPAYAQPQPGSYQPPVYGQGGVADYVEFVPI